MKLTWSRNKTKRNKGWAIRNLGALINIHAQFWSTPSSTNATLYSTCSWPFLLSHTFCIWRPSSSSSSPHHYTTAEQSAMFPSWSLCTSIFEYYEYRRPPSFCLISLAMPLVLDISSHVLSLSLSIACVEKEEKEGWEAWPLLFRL